MSDYQYKVDSDQAAASQILRADGFYHAFWGAGLSAEAEVPTAEQICSQIARSQLRINGFGGDIKLDDPDIQAWLNENLSWDRIEERYAKCIRRQYRNPADRVEFFRATLARKHPSFAHHGAAILMNAGVLARTCLTTNFDKLLENAFATQGARECQPLRTAGEIQFWREDPERCFCIKLHGDYDTHNVLNTEEETVQIDNTLRTRSTDLLRNRGLIVLGLAGYEKSVYSFFDELTSPTNLQNGSLDRGLLWGVFVGPKPPGPLQPSELENEVHRAIQAGAVGPEIIKMMNRMAKSQLHFAFFPVFGSGQFLIDLIEFSENKSLIGHAEPFLDHELRLRRTFATAKLPAKRIDEHIQNLKKPKPGSTNLDGQRARVERAFEVSQNQRSLWVAYGDIASRSFLGNETFDNQIRAVVSPDDTFLSVGGGVAAALAKKAGVQPTLHEVSKFAPVPQGESRVTSGGFLPVHYIFHAATIKVTKDSYEVSEDDVHRTFRDVLWRAAALEVGVLSVPLLGAGVAGLSPEGSFQGLTKAYKELFDQEKVPVIVIFVIYQESQLARLQARRILEKTLGGNNYSWNTAPWPPPSLLSQR